jgi:uncharacterized protein (TIGR02271 family)
MAIVDYSKQDEFDLVNENQDCRGWAVVDQSGNKIGTVSEMLVNSETMMVDSIIVDKMKRIPAADFALQNKQVVVRGVLDNEEHERTRQGAAANAVGGAQSYEAIQRAQNTNAVSGLTRAANENEVTLPIIEEQLQVGKRTVQSGGARVRTEIEEIPVEEQVRLREEHVHVERRPVDRPVGNAPEAFREGVIEVTEHAEVPVVSKEARVVEEVVIGKEVTERQETVRDTVRRSDVEVDEVDDARDVNTRRNS